jgi:uncharacterized membrane protein
MSKISSQSNKKQRKESFARSVVKTVSYSLVVIALDFTVVYLLTRRVDMAFGFMAISNIYTTVAYFFHERIWDKITWGKGVA